MLRSLVGSEMCIRDRYDDTASAHTSRSAVTTTNTNNKYHQDPSAVRVEANASNLLLPRFRSYGERRRLPLWQEFLYSKFRKDFHLIQHHIVDIPAWLLAQRKESIWLQVLSAEHYFRLEEELYSVECEGPPPNYSYGPEAAQKEESDSDQDDMAWLETIADFAQDANSNRRTSLQVSGTSATITSRSLDTVSLPNSPFSPTGPTPTVAVAANTSTYSPNMGPHRASATSIRRPSISRKNGSTPANAAYVDDFTPRDDDEDEDEVHPHQPRQSVSGSPQVDTLDNDDDVVAGTTTTPRSIGNMGRGGGGAAAVRNSSTTVFDLGKSSESSKAGDKQQTPRDFPDGSEHNISNAIDPTKDETSVFAHNEEGAADH
eukprot:TRINITY_DN14171_c0_g1_i1.p1 TRINITY_DN14171_c0_g1~~TRINITY_DN14171_c0_g1_i1.p1  ORF type:complete len:374 (-),score=76.14 TRINITY_DN14171_c0_g1_i1:369-1490(-)